MGILDTVAARSTAATTGNAAAPAQQDRKPSEFWLNIGANLEGMGREGEDVFVSLPSGLPLDDMKPTKVTGTDQHSINLKQTKNMLLEELQQLGASMQPGERRVVPLQVEIYRVAKPAQVGNAEENPMARALFGALAGK